MRTCDIIFKLCGINEEGDKFSHLTYRNFLKYDNKRNKGLPPVIFLSFEKISGNWAYQTPYEKSEEVSELLS